jgi:hypothetical protein
MKARTSKSSTAKRDPRYFGTICTRHPKLMGERYTGNGCCVACKMEARRRRTQKVKDMRMFFGYSNRIGLSGWPVDKRHPANKPVKLVDGWIVPVVTRR